MIRIVTTAIFFLICLNNSPFPAQCAERSAVGTIVQPVPPMMRDTTSVKPAISEISLLRAQLTLLRQDLEKEKAAREKLHTEMQKKIDFLVGLLNLNSQKVTKLERLPGSANQVNPVVKPIRSPQTHVAGTTSS